MTVEGHEPKATISLDAPPTSPRAVRTCEITLWRFIVDYLILAFVMPVVLSFIAYFEFVSHYSKPVIFSLSVSREQFYSSIYRYRVLGRELLFQIHRLIEVILIRLHRPDIGSTFVQQYASDGSFALYVSYFVLNTTFLCLFILVLVRIFDKGPYVMSDIEKRFRTLVILLFTVIAGFAVVPYDTLSLFLFSLNIYLTLQYLVMRDENVSGVLTIAAMLIVTVLATLTRETATLSLSFFATIYYLRFGVVMRPRELAVLAALVFAFLVPYIALRVHYGSDDATFKTAPLLAQLHAPHPLVGLTITFSMFAMLIGFSEGEWRRLGIFSFFSLPYIFGIVVFALWIEVRLWIPLMLAAVVLSPLNFRRLRPPMRSSSGLSPVSAASLRL